MSYALRQKRHAPGAYVAFGNAQKIPFLLNEGKPAVTMPLPGGITVHTMAHKLSMARLRTVPSGGQYAHHESLIRMLSEFISVEGQRRLALRWLPRGQVRGEFVRGIDTTAYHYACEIERLEIEWDWFFTGTFYFRRRDPNIAWKAFHRWLKKVRRAVLPATRKTDAVDLDWFMVVEPHEDRSKGFHIHGALAGVEHLDRTVFEQLWKKRFGDAKLYKASDGAIPYSLKGVGTDEVHFHASRTLWGSASESRELKKSAVRGNPFASSSTAPRQTQLVRSES